MVKKLFKHEYHFYLRIMAIVYGILLTMSVATRLIATFESDTKAYEIISTFTLITYYISILAAFGFAFVLGIVRFYKNMFTCEGYLTNTLPVTASQHIMVKSITAFSMDLLSAIAVALSVFIVKMLYRYAGWHSSVHEAYRHSSHNNPYMEKPH